MYIDNPGLYGVYKLDFSLSFGPIWRSYEGAPGLCAQTSRFNDNKIEERIVRFPLRRQAPPELGQSSL